MAKVLAIPTTLARYRVPESILVESAEKLRTLSGGRRESVVLWQGRVIDDRTAEITRLVIPRQVTGPYHFNIPLSERLGLIAEVSNDGEFILVQLHTHPQKAFHSHADDEMAITKHEGAISIVVPYFGKAWQGSFTEVTVHKHQGKAVWRQLTASEVNDLLEVVR